MRSTLVLVAAAAAIATAGSATAESDADHAAHHPVAASAPAASASMGGKPFKPKAATKSPAPTPAQMDAQMQAMREMHEKMMSARTPEERQALMADHMKAMRDGMAMMGQMQPDSAGADRGMPMHHEAMGKRLDMMQMMMQMMMDRDPAAAPSAK